MYLEYLSRAMFTRLNIEILVKKQSKNTLRSQNTVPPIKLKKESIIIRSRLCFNLLLISCHPDYSDGHGDSSHQTISCCQGHNMKVGSCVKLWMPGPGYYYNQVAGYGTKDQED